MRERILSIILDKHVKIVNGTRIGFDVNEDLARGFSVSPNGVTVVPQGTIISGAPRPAEVREGVSATCGSS